MTFPLLFIIGLICGSFANVIVDRLAKKKSGIFWGRSSCPHCRHTLAATDLIPLLSFIFLRGKCRYCRKKISPQYPLVELGIGLFFGITIFLNFTGLALGLVLLYFFILATVSIYDLKYLEIPDQVIIPGIGIALLAAIAGLSPAPPITDALIGAAIPITFFLLQFFVSRGKWIGLGDVRIAALMGLILGWQKTLVALFLAYLLGSLIGAIGLATGKFTRQSHVPFGPFLAAGTIAAFFFGQNILDWYLTRFF